MHDHHDWAVEAWNALTHGVGLLAALLGSAVLLAGLAPRADGVALGAAIAYCTGLVAVFAASTLYHAVPHLATKRHLRIVDHCTIFLLIAGTYTPFCLLPLRGHGGGLLFAAVWTIAALGIVLKLFHTGRFRRASTLLYLAMGWLALAAIVPMLRHVPAATLAWLLGGGLAYSAGTVFYMSSRRHAHAVWHGFVLAGAACHFVAVAMVLRGYRGATLLADALAGAVAAAA